MTVDHKFGNISTDLKLSLVEAYLHAFTTALRPKFQELWYIDAFAGAGHRTIKHAAKEADFLGPAEEERIEQRRGSARIALEVNPPFDRVVFIEKKRAHCRALERLRENYPAQQRVDIVRADANDALLQELSSRKNWAVTKG